EVEPAALSEFPVAVGAHVAAAVALAEEQGEDFLGRRQALEHHLAPLHVGLAVLATHPVDAQGKERMAVRRDQVPAAVALLGAEEAAGLEAGTAAQPPEAIPFGQLTEPAVQGGLGIG